MRVASELLKLLKHPVKPHSQSDSGSAAALTMRSSSSAGSAPSVHPACWPPLAAVAAGCGLTHSLIGTGVGADFIDGVQGRYLVPLVPLAAWLMPIRGPRSDRPRRVLPWLTVVAIAVATAISLVAIVERYYRHGFEPPF